GRVSGHGRSIGRAESPAFEQFAPLSLVLQTDEKDPADSDLYNPAAYKYPYADNVYLMFPSLYMHAPDTLDIRIAVSRDGVHWSWPEQGKSFVPLGSAGAFDSGSLYMGQGMIRVGNELWQYFSGSTLKHNEAELEPLSKPENKRVFSRIVSRVDGFVSVDAGDSEGGFTTPPIKYQGTKLQLNVKTGVSGEVRVGLSDAEGNPIPGLAIDECLPITGDHIDAAVAWKAAESLSEYAGNPVKLTVKMKNASLFSFQFLP
ncbi:MAG: hypothetical protein WC655_01550, partial [Candidatus Hydrogenedentales bacterium]